MNKRIFELTVDEFLDILKQQFPIATNVVKADPATEKKYIYSIQGLADFLQCSIVTAQKIKNSGRINYQQIGRKVIFEESEILKSMSVINGRRVKK